MKTMLFIMNPVSGQKRAAKFLPDLISLFNGAGYEVITAQLRPVIDRLLADEGK